jgi:hypothetical protein
MTEDEKFAANLQKIIDLRIPLFGKPINYTEIGRKLMDIQSLPCASGLVFYQRRCKISADNGVYIGRFTKDDGFEYRVIHAQAIENCDYDKSFPEKLIHAYRVIYYGASEVYDKEGAWKRAQELYEEVMKDWGICEYGVSEIQYNEPFPQMIVEEARKFIDEYWEEHQKKRLGSEAKLE